METAKLFKNGRSQAVRLPKEFRFEGDEVYVYVKAGRRRRHAPLRGRPLGVDRRGL
jgi:antitoxin VapB